MYKQKQASQKRALSNFEEYKFGHMQKNRYNQRYRFRERVVDGQTYRHTSQVSQNPCALLGSNKRVFLPET